MAEPLHGQIGKDFKFLGTIKEADLWLGLKTRHFLIVAGNDLHEQFEHVNSIIHDPRLNIWYMRRESADQMQGLSKDARMFIDYHSNFDALCAAMAILGRD